MRTAWVAGLLLLLATAAQAQTPPPFNPDELLKCMSAQELDKLAEDYVKGVMERSAPLIAERKQQLELALQKSEQAEARYKLCMKVESADRAAQSNRKLPACTAERDNWFVARKEANRLVSKAERDAFKKRLEPFEKLEQERFDLMVKLRCPK